MEKQPHQEYRDDLAKDLKNIPDHKDRKEALYLEKNSFRYDKATELHKEDINVFKSLLESSEKQANGIVNEVWSDILNVNVDELELNEQGLAAGPCLCQLTGYEGRENETVRNLRAFLGRQVSGFSDSVDSGLADDDDLIKDQVNKLVSQRVVLAFSKLKRVFGNDSGYEPVISGKTNIESLLEEAKDRAEENPGPANLPCMLPSSLKTEIEKILRDRNISKLESELK